MIKISRFGPKDFNTKAFNTDNSEIFLIIDYFLLEYILVH